MNSAKNGFVGSLAGAVQENPVAAALIGGGALWLLLGNDKLKAAVGSASAAASSAVDAGAQNLRGAASRFQTTSAPPTAPELDSDGSSRLGDAYRRTSAAASDAISGATEKVRDRFDDGVAFAQENLGRFGEALPGKEDLTNMQSSLANLLDRQPLALGAVGLAIGAAVAGAFQISDVENVWVGNLSDKVKADMSDRAGAVTQSLREASDMLTAEFSDAGAEAVDRVKQAGTDAADAAREKLKLREMASTSTAETQSKS
jgi:hypothetical protein